MGKYDWAIGVSFAIASSVLSCLGLIFQKYAHNQNQALPDEKKYPVKLGIVCSPCWWASFIMMGLFPFPFDFFAYSFAAQSLVAPFAGLTLIMNQFFAPCILKEQLHRIDIYASLVVFVGCVLTTATGNHDEETYTLDDLLRLFRQPGFIVGIITLLAIMAGMLASLGLTDPLKSRARPRVGALEPIQDEIESDSDASSGERDAARGAFESTPKTWGSFVRRQLPATNRYTDALTSALSAAENFVHGLSVDATKLSKQQHQDAEPGPVVVRRRSSSSEHSLRDAEAQEQGNAPHMVSLAPLEGSCAHRLAMANFALRPFYYGFVSGGFGALQNIFFKSVGVLMKTSVFDGGPSAWGTWYPYVFLLTTAVLAVAQLSFLNKGMSRYDAVLVFPLYNASYIFLSVTMGGLYYEEFASFSAVQSALFPIGVLVTMAGVIFFVFKPRPTISEEGKASTVVLSRHRGSVHGESVHGDSEDAIWSKP